MQELGDEFDLVVSDKTGAFPGDRGLGERLGFIYRQSAVKRMEMASDITYDKSKLIDSIVNNYEQFTSDMEAYRRKLAEYEAGKRSKSDIKLQMFLSFIRQPFCVAFRIDGHPGTTPYELMAINAHLLFGNGIQDRRQEFNALLEWIMNRLGENSKAYYPDFVLLGDLNLDYNNPATDRERIEKQIKSLNDGLQGTNVNFPFLDPHQGRTEVFPDERAVDGNI